MLLLPLRLHDATFVVRVQDRVNREELGLVSDAQEDVALTETEARVWRRKLESRRKNRNQGASYISHGHATVRGMVSARCAYHCTVL